MLEKSAKVILTKRDLQEYNEGLVSNRVQEAWGFSLAELQNIIENKDFELITPTTTKSEDFKTINTKDVE